MINLRRSKEFAKYFISTRKKCSTLSYFHQGDKDPLIYRTLGQQLELSAQKYQNTLAITSYHEKGSSATFPEVFHRADKLAAGLANLGFKAGDRIGLWMPNTLSWYISMMGIARLGAVCVALNPAYQVPEMDYCIKKVGIKAIITTKGFKTQNYHKMLTEIFPGMNEKGNTKIEAKDYAMERVIVDSDQRLSGSLTFDEISKSSEQEMKNIQELQDQIQPDDPCNIQFTSGTTGKPKAAVLTHNGIITNGFHNGTRLLGSEPYHKICLSIPFFHVYALVVGLTPALYFGSTICLPSAGFDSKASISCFKDEKCTYVYGTPTMFVDLVTQLKKKTEKFDSLKFAVTGGSPISPKLLEDMEEYLGVKTRSIFGMTETLISFVSLPSEPKDRVLNSVGKLTNHMEAKVVDANGKIVPFGVPGELWVRGYGTMLGYFEDEAKTRESITDDRWMKTGDQFVLHEDGYGKIVGRIKELIIRGGENIFPKEIEDFLNTHPDIAESFVIGVPDDRMGEEVAACIKMSPGAKKNLTQEDIKEFCKGKLAHFKVPRYVKLMSEFPKTTSGKIQKFKLVEEFRKNLPE